MSTDAILMTDTDIDELEAAINRARQDFVALARSSDPTARVGEHWSVRDVVAHVYTVAQRYTSVAATGTYRRAEGPRDLDSINDAEVAALADVPYAEILTRLEDCAGEISHFLRGAVGKGRIFPFHGGEFIDATSGATNWIGELRIHGYDIARAVKAPWTLPERDALLVLAGVQQIIPGYVDQERAAGKDVLIEMRLPGARPWVTHVVDRTAISRPRAEGDRPHAVIKAPASTLLLSLYGRYGNLAAARHGLQVVGGRRPWRALTFPSLFEQP
ncbi:maleylpyruvate isomerase N-terminal domain-containing protein [Nocardioides ultimimeridianus]